MGLALAAALVGAWLLYNRFDEEIRRRVEAKIAGHYEGLTVRVRHAQLIAGQGIEIRGLSILEKDAAGPQAELAYLDEVFLACDTNLEELVKGQPNITDIRIRRPVLRATRRPGGSWSVSRLMPFPRFSDSTPNIDVENATLELFDPLKNPSSTLTVRDINLALRPRRDFAGPGIAPLDVQGSLSAEHLQRVEVSGMVDIDQDRWNLAGTLDGLEVSPELRDSLPSELSEPLAVLGTLRGEGKLRFQLAHEPRAAGMLFEVEGQLVRGRIDDARLPYPLTDLKARLHANNSGFEIQELSARNGRSLVQLSCRRGGYSATSPMLIEATGSRLPLDQQLANVLPPSLRGDWNRYLPEGEVDAKLRLAFDGRSWTPEIGVHCLNVSFSYDKFPYRLERGTGDLSLKNGALDARLTAFTAGQAVQIDARFANVGKNFTGSVELKGNNIPFDEKLFVALPDQGRDVVRSMNPRGTFNFYSRIWRDDSQRAGVHQHFMVGLNRCSLNYDKFPYPITNIRGTLEMLDRHWTFRDLEGMNDTGFITCHGELAPVASGLQLVLNFGGTNVPLEEELRDALAPSMQRLWNSIRPRGTIDLTSQLRYSSDQKKLSLKLTAQPHGDTASIEPVCFPYRMEKLRGTIHYQDGHAQWERMDAVHGRTTLACGGECTTAADGGWRMQLKKITADRLRFDHELTAALPDSLRKAVAELKPTGAVNLRGAVDFKKPAGSEAPLQSQWDVLFELQQATLDCGQKFENICGGVRLSGGCDGKRAESRGELDLDCVAYKNFQCTDVRGPLWLDNQRVLFGSWAEARQGGRAPRRITAKAFGGVLLGDCQVTLGATPQYTLRANAADVDLAKFAKENLTGRQKLNGKVAATAELQGTSKGLHTLAGGGSVRLQDADIYELPLMVSLLKILSIRQPDATAFTTSDIDFRIQGEHVIFDKLNFNGDAVSLIGKGQMNLDTQVNLTFHAMVGRAESQLPVLRNMIGEASHQIMQIHVDGTMENPSTRNEAFPGVSQALQQLQAEFQRGRQSNSVRKTANREQNVPMR